MKRRPLLLTTATLLVGAGCTNGAAPGAEMEQTATRSPPQEETACEREYQLLPDIVVRNTTTERHQLSLTVSKVADGTTAEIYEHVYQLPKESERETEIAFTEPHATSPEAEYRATATLSDGGQASADVTSTVVVNPLRYGIEIAVEAGEVSVTEHHVDTSGGWSDSCLNSLLYSKVSGQRTKY